MELMNASSIGFSVYSMAGSNPRMNPHPNSATRKTTSITIRVAFCAFIQSMSSRHLPPAAAAPMPTSRKTANRIPPGEFGVACRDASSQNR